MCGYWHHDISAHEILSVIQDGKAVLLGAAPTVAVVPLPLPLRETAEEERKKIFKTKPRSSVGAKRKITVDEEEPRRWSTGHKIPSAALSAKPMYIIPKLIAMRRDGLIPLSNFDHMVSFMKRMMQMIMLLTTKQKNLQSSWNSRQTIGGNIERRLTIIAWRLKLM